MSLLNRRAQIAAQTIMRLPNQFCVPIIEKWITNPMYPAAPTIKSQSVHAII